MSSKKSKNNHCSCCKHHNCEHKGNKPEIKEIYERARKRNRNFTRAEVETLHRHGFRERSEDRLSISDLKKRREYFRKNPCMKLPGRKKK